MKKILVTGSTGFLGRRIAAHFSKGNQVYTPSHRELDITDEKNVERFLKSCAPDIVVHCAAMSDVRQCETEPERSWKINVDGCIHLARACKMIHAKCILCSSDQVYFGSEQTAAHTEDEPLRPGNLYGREKLKAEEECLKENPDCVLLRLSWMYDSVTRNPAEHGDFMRTLLGQLNTCEKLRYPVHDRRGITDVNEVISNLEKLFEIPGGVYNYGAPNDMSTYDLMHRVFTFLDLNTDRLVRDEKSFCDDPRNLCMNPEKAEKFGIVFPTTEEGILRNLKEKI